MQKPIKESKKRKKNPEEVECAEKSYKVMVKTSKNINSSNSKLPGLHDFWKLDKKTLNSKVDIKEIQKLTGSERNHEKEETNEIEIDSINPHTPEQFEKELCKDKNSSSMWIKFMKFHLETAEMDKARKVAKRAIASINYREEKELLNVWIAWIDLEIRFGTDDFYNDVLNEAAQRNNPFKVYSQTLRIFLELGKFIDANKIIEILKKKFKPLPEMWLLVAESYLKMDNEKLAKEILPKSLLSLTEKDHLEYMTQFALMMSRHNIHDFSQTIFEKILATYPKNLSIWFTYVDMMTKNGQIEITRSLFERMLVQKFPLKKLKSVFQKYIEFETKHGDTANISAIKKMAKNMLDVKEDE